MLWYKAWLDTRWRFVIGVALIACVAGEVVWIYPAVARLVPAAGTFDASSDLGRRIQASIELSRSYDGYLWSQAFRQSLVQLVLLFAVVLGTGGLLPARGRGSLLTLSFPVSRRRIVAVRAGIGLLELAGLSLAPAAVILAMSPAVGESFRPAAAAAHGLCLFAGGAVFFSLATLLSTEFEDVWRPLLVALFAGLVTAFLEGRAPGLGGAGVFSTMSGEAYFRAHALPWAGLLVSGVLSIALLYAAVVNFSRRDF